MVFERIPLGIDIPKLCAFFQKEVLPLPPWEENEAIGGWAILSGDGHYKGGFYAGHKCFQEAGKDSVADIDALKKMGARPLAELKRPTEICHGYLREVIASVAALGFSPRRARIRYLRPQGQSQWHRDALDHEYAVRMHIPFITNTACLFRTPHGEEHIPADGAGYLVHVNQLHQVENFGSENRFHIVMDVIDVRGVSQFHRFQPLHVR